MPLTLGLAASLFASTRGPTPAVHADPPPDPVARSQFILKTIHVRDDEDFLGSGGLFLFADLCGDSGTSPYTRPFTCGPGGSIAMEYRFSAGFASPTSR